MISQSGSPYESKELIVRVENYLPEPWPKYFSISQNVISKKLKGLSDKTGKSRQQKQHPDISPAFVLPKGSIST